MRCVLMGRSSVGAYCCCPRAAPYAAGTGLDQPVPGPVGPPTLGQERSEDWRLAGCCATALIARIVGVRAWDWCQGSSPLGGGEGAALDTSPTPEDGHPCDQGLGAPSRGQCLRRR